MYSTNLWQDKCGTAEDSHGAYYCEVVCSALARMLSESDRQVDLSQRTYSRACERSMFVCVQSLSAQCRWSTGTGNRYFKHYSRCGGDRELGGVIYRYFKVGTISFAF